METFIGGNTGAGDAAAPMPEARGRSDEAVLAYVTACQKAYSDRAGLEERWRRWEQAAHNIPNTRYYSGHSKLFVPETRRAIKAWINFTDEVLFSLDEYFRVIGVGTERDQMGAQILQRLIHMQNRRNRFRSAIRRGLWDKAVKGVAIYKYGWATTSVVRLRDPIGYSRALAEGAEKPADEQVDIVDVGGLFFEAKSLWNVWWDMFEENWDNQQCIIERTYVTKSWLRAQQRLGNITVDLDRILAEIGDESRDGKQRNERVNFGDEITGVHATCDVGRQKYELWEAWATYDFDEDGVDEECLFWVLNGRYVLRKTLNPYEHGRKPYLIDIFERVEGTSVGYGIPHLTEKDQIGLNDAMNQIMDNITMILNNMWIVDKNANIPAWQLKSRPNGVIESELGPEAVQPVGKIMTANEGLRAVAMFKDNIRVATGMTQPMTGAQARYDTTAYEYSQLSAAGSREVISMVRDTEENVIEPYLRAAYSIDLQFLDREDFVRIFGASGSALGDIADMREVLRGDYDFEPVGVTHVESKVTQMTQMLNFLNILAAIPGARIHKVANIIWQQFLGRKEQVLPEEPEPVLVAPQDENLIMQGGEPVAAKIVEPHEYHIAVHQSIPQTPVVEDHIRQHMEMMAMRKQAQAQIQTPVPVQEMPRTEPQPVVTGEYAATRQMGAMQ